ncbi:hypothetical protein ACEWY4_018783 [Coilia grayii]|uniref:Synaptonemal complex protein 2 Spt16M-like domain-containing protein n=1 Tax=Coilia grayii TaxID=363190 RepID=A0ABD1JE70_9TELE
MTDSTGTDKSPARPDKRKLIHVRQSLNQNPPDPALWCSGDGRDGVLQTQTGYYEFQVAITEALSRMTIKRTREEVIRKWFGPGNLASSFMAIKFVEFETLFKPKDENLKEFWIDFNIGSSCITFSVHDPEVKPYYLVYLLGLLFSVHGPEVKPYYLAYLLGLLFSVHGPEVKPYYLAYLLSLLFSVHGPEVKPYYLAYLLMMNDQKVLTVSTTSPVLPYGKLSGCAVQLFFSACHEIAAAVQKVFGDPPPSGPPPKPNNTRGGLSWDEVVGIASDELGPLHLTPSDRNYTRRKPKVKVLPLSSPSSGEERHAKDISLSQESFLLGKRPHESPESSVTHRRKQAVAGLQLQDLYTSNPLEGAADTIVAEGKDPDADLMGSDVMAAFRSFKTQLMDHVAAKYQKIESKSLQSLSDCQVQVTSLLKNVHAQRLQLMERFEQVVVEQLGRLEQDCRSLRNIEQETMTFWRTEYQAVKSFCERQQSRLGSLGICNGLTTQHSPREPGQGEAETMEYSG